MSTALLPPENISSGTWAWKDPLLGFNSGFSNTIWFSFRDYNAIPSKEKKDLPIWNKAGFLWQSLPIHNANSWENRNLSHLTGLSPLKIKAIQFSGYVLAGLNAGTLFNDVYKLDLSQAVGSRKLCVVVFQATPYLMVITNVTLMALQLRYNQMRAVVELATTFVVIPLVNSLPESLYEIVAPKIHLSLQAISFYYGGNWSRLYIISRWALSSTSYGKKIQSIFLSGIVYVMKSMREKAGHERDCECISCGYSQFYQELLRQDELKNK